MFPHLSEYILSGCLYRPFLLLQLVTLPSFIFGTVHYEGTLAETGEVFDTTHEDNTIFTFEVGSGSVIKAWDVALKTMKVNYSFYTANTVIPP